MRSISTRFAQSLVLSSALFASAVSGVAHASTGDPSQWGVHDSAATTDVAKKGSFDITELAAGGTSKGGEVPVVPGVARKVNEYEGQHLANGKNGEVPVVSGRAEAGGGGGTGEVIIISG